MVNQVKEKLLEFEHWRVNGCVNGRVNGCVNGLPNGWVIRHVNGRVNECVKGLMKGWVIGCVIGRVNGLMNGCVIGCLKARPIPFLSNDNVAGAVMMCFMRGPPISTIFPTLVT